MPTASNCCNERTTEAALTQLLVAVNCIANDAQRQHQAPAPPLQCVIICDSIVHGPDSVL